MTEASNASSDTSRGTNEPTVTNIDGETITEGDDENIDLDEEKNEKEKEKLDGSEALDQQLEELSSLQKHLETQKLASSKHFFEAKQNELMDMFKKMPPKA